MANSYGLKMQSLNPKETCAKLLQLAGIRHYRIGISKLFIKNEEIDFMEKEQIELEDDINNNNLPRKNLQLNNEINQANMTINQGENFKTTPRLRHTQSFKLQQETKKVDMIQPKLEQEYWWDVARVTSRDFEIEQMHLKSRAETFKILFKLFAYLVFFLIVLGSSVVSKLSLFTMVNAIKKSNQVG